MFGRYIRSPFGLPAVNHFVQTLMHPRNGGSKPTRRSDVAHWPPIAPFARIARHVDLASE
jgi:hypothetical protein